MFLSIAAFYRALRPLYIIVAFFVSATISVTVFSSLSLSLCVFFLLGCLLGLYTHFFAEIVPVIAVDDKVVCVEEERVDEIDKRDGIIEVEA